VIVLDTNVLSALMRAEPDPAVVRWLDLQPAKSLWTTAVTLFEVRYGILALPAGKRRKALQDGFEALLRLDLEGRVLDFDSGASTAAAEIAARNRAAGRTVDIRDVQIAGIVASRRGALATRNARHFEATGIAIVDPWAADPGRRAQGAHRARLRRRGA
jgi:predicted nucleic acid-binding protein